MASKGRKARNRVLNLAVICNNRNGIQNYVIYLWETTESYQTCHKMYCTAVSLWIVKIPRA